MNSKLILLLLLLVPFPLLAQDAPRNTHKEMEIFIDSLFQQGVRDKLIPGGVVSLVSSDHLYLGKAYGVSDVSNNAPVEWDRTLFQLGSVGKTVTAIAVTQQVEAGNLEWDREVNTYLDNKLLKNRYSRPVRVSHLLSHTAGLSDRNIGYIARSNDQLQPLGTFLHSNMPGLFQPPGNSINYSNYGYGLAGFLVERVSGTPFRQYVHNHIMTPLEIADTGYLLPDNYRDLEQYAKGYQTRSRFIEVESHPRNLWPAGSLLSTGKDMSIFVQSLLKKDALLLESWDPLYATQYTDHPLLPGVTYGFEEQRIHDHRFLAKGGVVPGFLSFILLFPRSDMGLFVSVNTETDNFIRTFIRRFADRFFPGMEKSEPSYQGTADLQAFRGSYRNLRANHHSLENLFAMLMDNIRIEPDGENQLGVIRGDRYTRYRAVNDSIFASLNNPDQLLVFAGDGESYDRIHTTVTAGGLQVPATYGRLSWLLSPNVINTVYPVLLIPIPLYFTVLLFWLGMRIHRRGKPETQITNSIPAGGHLAALGFSVLFAIDVFGFFIPLISSIQGGEILFGLPSYFIWFRYLHWLMAILLMTISGYVLLLWIRKPCKAGFALLYTLYATSGAFYIFILVYWNFLNVQV